MKIDVLQVAERLDRLAAADRRNHPTLNDGAAVDQGAAAIRAAHAAYRREFRRAEAALRRVGELQTRLASLQAELVQQRANVRALEAVAAQPAPYATEQDVQVDSRGNIKKIVTRPLPERRPAGFSA